MFLKVQQNTKNIEEHMIMFGDEEFKFVDDSAMIIKIKWQDLLVFFYIEEIYGVWLHEKRLIWAVTISFFLFCHQGLHRKNN